MLVVWQVSAAGTTLPPKHVGGEGRLTSRSEVNRGGGPTLAPNLRHPPPPRSLRSRPSPPLRGGRVEPAARVQPNAPISYGCHATDSEQTVMFIKRTVIS